MILSLSTPKALVAVSLLVSMASAQEEPPLFPLSGIREIKEVEAEPLMRMIPQNLRYEDGEGSMKTDLPNPRTISNFVAKHPAQNTDRKSRRHLSDMVWAWGQFIGALTLSSCGMNE